MASPLSWNTCRLTALLPTPSSLTANTAPNPKSQTPSFVSYRLSHNGPTLCAGNKYLDTLRRDTRPGSGKSLSPQGQRFSCFLNRPISLSFIYLIYHSVIYVPWKTKQPLSIAVGVAGISGYINVRHIPAAASLLHPGLYVGGALSPILLLILASYKSSSSISSWESFLFLHLHSLSPASKSPAPRRQERFCKGTPYRTFHHY